MSCGHEEEIEELEEEIYILQRLASQGPIRDQIYRLKVLDLDTELSTIQILERLLR